MFGQFTDSARKVISLAPQEAQRFNHDYIGTEHVLLGLVQEGSGIAAKVLKNLNVDLLKVRLEVEKLVSPGSPTVQVGQPPFTPRAKRVIELAQEAATQLGSDVIGTEHLLLGLMKENEGIAAQVLINLGLKLDDVRDEVNRVV
jgi:ATP-dependent Clp protease ATP-binding subunit ClpC